MAQTQRISYTSAGQPIIELNLGADIVAQSQSGNYSVVRISAQGIRRSGSTSFSNNNGSHVCAIDGYAGSASRSGTLPSGVPINTISWDVSADITIAHDADGNKSAVTLRQTQSGWHPTDVRTASFGGFPRIPKAPSAPGTPTFTEVLPTSVRVSWTASADNAGSAITGYLLRYWPNAEGTGAYVDVSSTNDLSRVVSGLTPGQQYRFVVYAMNGSHAVYSVASGAAVVRTLSGMWSKLAGVWYRTIPYVKVNGIWTAVSVFIKDAGVWKRGG